MPTTDKNLNLCNILYVHPPNLELCPATSIHTVIMLYAEG